MQGNVSAKSDNHAGTAIPHLVKCLAVDNFVNGPNISLDISNNDVIAHSVNMTLLICVLANEGTN